MSGEKAEPYRNGSAAIHEFREHLTRNEIRLNTLEQILKEGFAALVKEMQLNRMEFSEQMKLMRETPYVPVTVMQSVLDGYKAALTPVIKILTITLGGAIVVILALKHWLPQLLLGV
jgi:hypothetical protein